MPKTWPTGSERIFRGHIRPRCIDRCRWHGPKYCAGGCDIGPKGFDGKFKVLQTLRKVYITYNDL